MEPSADCHVRSCREGARLTRRLKEGSGDVGCWQDGKAHGRRLGYCGNGCLARASSGAAPIHVTGRQDGRDRKPGRRHEDERKRSSHLRGGRVLSTSRLNHSFASTAGSTASLSFDRRGLLIPITSSLVARAQAGICLGIRRCSYTAVDQTRSMNSISVSQISPSSTQTSNSHRLSSLALRSMISQSVTVSPRNTGLRRTTWLRWSGDAETQMTGASLVRLLRTEVHR